MTELSPQAQAVLNAANGACLYGPDDVLNDSRWIAAAALRAAAYHIDWESGDPKLLLENFANELESQ